MQKPEAQAREKIDECSGYELWKSLWTEPSSVVYDSNVSIETFDFIVRGEFHRLDNGSMSANQSGEGDIRRGLIAADLVDCMVALPGQLYSTQIPVCLWFLSKSKAARLIKSSDRATPVSFRERRRAT